MTSTDPFLEAVDRAYATVVRVDRGPDADPRYRRHVGLSLDTARRRAESARAAGHTAEVTVVELHPIGIYPTWGTP